MQVKFVAITSNSPPTRLRFQRTRRRAVNGLAVHFHPRADGVQIFDCALRNDSLTGRTDVEQVISADRKSTRLNSSHLGISYAVFCLEKIDALEGIMKMSRRQFVEASTLVCAAALFYGPSCAYAKYFFFRASGNPGDTPPFPACRPSS